MPNPHRPRDAASEQFSEPVTEIRQPTAPVAHREDRYEEAGLDHLARMQEQHYWYLARHRFLLHAVRHQLRSSFREKAALSAIDLGGGCGGWVKYLHRYAPELFGELALADSSLRALDLAEPVVGDFAERHRADLLDLPWESRWDVVFLLDVLEHIEDDIEAVRQIRKALRPGGLLVVTTPALQIFWSYNDEVGHHKRRYSRPDFRRLAGETGFDLLRVRYFMFLLSPFLLLRRFRRPDLTSMSAEETLAHIAHTHRVPSLAVNQTLRGILSLETPIGWHLPLPWGTSILGVFRKSER